MKAEQIYLYILTGVPISLLTFSILNYLNEVENKAKARLYSLSEYDLSRSKSIWGQDIGVCNIILQVHRAFPPLAKFTAIQGAKAEATLLEAGKPGNMTGEQFIAFKELCAFLGFILMVAVLQVSNPVYIFAVTALAFFLPDLKLRDTINSSKKSIIRELPDALDTLGLMVGAGQGFNQAVDIYLKKSSNSKANSKKPTLSGLSAQLTIYQREMALGKSSQEALKGMSDRAKCAPLSDFVLSTVQAQRTGTPLSNALEEQAATLREKRFQLADMAGQKAVVKLLFPLMFFILPCCFLILFGPLLVNYINK